MAMKTLERRTLLQAGLQSLNDALMKEDELGMVIRAHIHIEHAIIDFLKTQMTDQVLGALSLDYSGRVRLALALGLHEQFKAALNFVGTLRNRFAHRLDATLSKEDADNFAHALGPENRDIAARSYALVHAKLPNSERPDHIDKNDYRDRIILYFVTLWSGVALTASMCGENAD